MMKPFSKKPKQNSKENSQLAKITNSTLEAEREEILNNGRKFKYPVQYSKRRLVAVTVIIAAIVALASGILLWRQLYIAQNTGTLIYRISTVLPLPVANVDGENALYSDYLADYRANMNLSQSKAGMLELIKDENTRSNNYKKQAMDNVIRNTYALKIAHEKNITVSDEEINEVLHQQRIVNGVEMSEAAFNRLIETNYGLSPSEYRRIFTELPLIRKKVAASIDSKASNLKDEISKFLKENNNDFAKIAENFQNQNVEVGASGTVNLSNVDGGKAEAAVKLNTGQVSEAFVSKSGDGYYFVKLIAKNDKELSYEYIKISFTALEEQIKNLESEGKIHKYIKIEEQ